MIKLTRVDYRLIHGQVAMSWTHALDVDGTVKILSQIDRGGLGPALL